MRNGIFKDSQLLHGTQSFLHSVNFDDRMLFVGGKFVEFLLLLFEMTVLKPNYEEQCRKHPHNTINTKNGNQAKFSRVLRERTPLRFSVARSPVGTVESSG